jgi:hypothetical protein
MRIPLYGDLCTYMLLCANAIHCLGLLLPCVPGLAHAREEGADIATAKGVALSCVADDYLPLGLVERGAQYRPVV